MVMREKLHSKIVTSYKIVPCLSWQIYPICLQVDLGSCETQHVTFYCRLIMETLSLCTQTHWHALVVLFHLFLDEERQKRHFVNLVSGRCASEVLGLMTGDRVRGTRTL